MKEKKDKANHSVVLYGLLVSNKKGCAEWLIDSFGICLDDVLSMFKKWGRSGSRQALSLSTWRMILNKFPELDCETAWKMIPVVRNIVWIAEYTLARYRVQKHGAIEQRLLNRLCTRCGENITNEFRLWKADRVAPLHQLDSHFSVW
ncbi:hypothetical protein Pelo_19220 [Pelomyxa schiedti]|nr:hypothetical protein Pelo_19220 [Pelomyxa schiedti]